VEAVLERRSGPDEASEYYVKWALRDGGPSLYVWLKEKDITPEELALFNK
jgi:hypothetical protein